MAPKGKALLVKAILVLLALGVLSYGYLPSAYCPLEDKTVRYIYLSDSRKTATVVFSVGNGEFEIGDDRCQKGMVIGEWQPLKEIPQKECPTLVSYVTNCETGKTDKWICEGFNDPDCKEWEGLLPFE